MKIAPLPVLPLFHKLAARRVVIAGVTEGARWKAELCAAAGADVHVYGAGAEGDWPGTVHARDWVPADLDGAALAFADLDAPDAFHAAAKAAGVPVNIIDNPQFCDFQTATIVNRAPVVVAISTDGAAPILAQAIRTRIETLLPPAIAHWAALAKAWRPWAKAALPAPERRRFWESLAARAFDTAPDAGLRDMLRGDAGGRVFLVGAGPGDPDLLTVRAARVLQLATVILHDDLVDPRILETARRESTRVNVGKRGGKASMDQAAINALIVDHAQRGDTVVRLKGGDPMIFGRATEELDACAAAGIAVEVVPGITSAQGAAARLGVSLTERGVARRVQYVTGHDATGALPRDLDWTRIADTDATTVVYMPRATLAAFVARAVAAGLSPATPALGIAAATRPDETVVRATLVTLEQAIGGIDPALPLLVIIGQVVRDRVPAAEGLAA